MNKERMLKSKQKLDRGEPLDCTDWAVLRYLVSNRIYSKWKLALCERLLWELQEVVYSDDQNQKPLDEDVRFTARVVVRSDYLYRRMALKPPKRQGKHPH